MSRKILFMIIGVCLVGVVFAFAMNRFSHKSQASGSNFMFQEINSSALSAQSGQAADIDNLVDTIFAENGIDLLDPSLVASLKDRIVRAEVSGQTVSEAQVVQTLNWLASEFSAPNYARTSLLQTRSLRLVSNQLMPNLFRDKDNQGNIGLNKPLYSKPSNNMLATQSITLLIFMIEQKVLNENFQKDPAIWDSDYYAAQRAGISSQPANSGNSAQLISRRAPEKTSEMRQLVYGSNFSQSDQARLMQGALDQLGIPR